MVKRVTMDDIAHELNVSKSLVSLALSGKYGVSDETRSEIVMKALEMGYEMREKKRRNNSSIRKIALLVHRIADMSSRFWREIIKGAQKVLIENKVVLNIVSWNDELSETEVAVNLYDLHCDGILILNKCPPALLDLVYNLGSPIVLIDFMDCVDNRYSQVRANNYLGGFEAAKYLISKGHEKLIYFGNNEFSYSFRSRYQGFCDYVSKYAKHVKVARLTNAFKNARERYAKTLDESFLICNPESLRIFLDGNKGYTAIMCANDAVAAMAMEQLRGMGIRVGQDISLMTFDNTRICETSNPPLTSVNVPKEVIGKKAVEMLFSLVREKNRKEDFPSVLEVNTEIVERQSVINLKGQNKTTETTEKYK